MGALATRVIDFSTGQTLVASGVEVFLDPEGNRDADGNSKSQFYAGDTVAILATMPDDLRLVRAACTFGSLSLGGAVSRSWTDQILFVVVDEAQGLSKRPAGVATAKWYGNTGTITTDLDLQTVAAGSSSTLPCIGDITYPFAAQSLSLAIPAGLVVDADESWPIGIVVYVEKIG